MVFLRKEAATLLTTFLATITATVSPSLSAAIVTTINPTFSRKLAATLPITILATFATTTDAAGATSASQCVCQAARFLSLDAITGAASCAQCKDVIPYSNSFAAGATSSDMTA